jgi:hypothetical protein
LNTAVLCSLMSGKFTVAVPKLRRRAVFPKIFCGLH